MRSSNIVLSPRKYMGGIAPASPPLTLEDTSRFNSIGAFTNVTWFRLPSGLSVLSCNGATSSISLGTPVGLRDVDRISIVAWINPTSLGGGNGGRIYVKQSRKLFHLYANNCLNFVQVFSIGNGQWVTANNSIKFGVWQQVAVTYDAGNIANDPIFYINGLSSTPNELMTPNGTRTSDIGSTAYIANESGGARAFDGYLFVTEIASVIYTADEIAARYEREKGDFGVR